MRMKHALIVFLLFVNICTGQHLAPNRYDVAAGEYNTWIVDHQMHRAWQVNHYASAVAGLPDSFATCAGGAHWAIFLTVGGNVWTWGDSSISTPTPARVMTDSAGNAFSNVVAIGSGGTAGSEPWDFWALKSDGTVWIWKYTNNGNRGDGTIGSYSSLPVQVHFPNGVFIKSVFVSFHGVALASNGDVYTWGADASFYAPYLLGQNCGACAQPYAYSHTPTKITLPAPCKMISGGSALMDYFLLTDGTLYATAWDIGYVGLQKYSGHQDMSYNNFLPIRVDTALKLPKPIDSLVQNSLGEFAILTDSSLWFWGSNACGNSGMGPEFNMRHYAGSNGWDPFNFDQGLDQAMTGNGINGQALPIQCMPGMKITKVFGSTGVNFYAFAENSHDSLLVAGRNKYGVIGNNKGYVDDNGAETLGNVNPNGLDVSYWTYINPWSSTTVITMTSPLCVDSSTSYCTTNPVNTSGSPPAPTITVGKTKGHYYVQGRQGLSSPATGVHDVLYTRDSGPGQFPFPLQANDTIALYNPAVGDHLIRYTVTDNNYKKTSVTAHVLVGWSRPHVGTHHFVSR